MHTNPPPNSSASRQHNPRHLCVTGYSAAGKTTHATLLAQQLSMSYLSASSLLYHELNYRNSGRNDIWIADASTLNARRRDERSDAAVDNRLMSIAGGTQPTVFDSWSLPFLAQKYPSISEAVAIIYLRSDVQSRALKCLVSQGTKPIMNVGQATALVEEKDRSTMQQFSSLYEMEADYDRLNELRKIDVTVDISRYTFGTGMRHVMQGIQAAHTIVLAEARNLLAVEHQQPNQI